MFRLLAVTSGLSTVAIANFTLAPTLSNGTPPPIQDAPADFFRSEGWGQASYIALGWWLSHEFENVEVHHAGFSGERVGVTLLEKGSPVDLPKVVATPVVVYHGDWFGLLKQVSGYIRTPPGQKVLCRTNDGANPELCDLSVAWRDPRSADEEIILDVVFSGEDDFLMIERDLLETLAGNFSSSDFEIGS